MAILDFELSPTERRLPDWGRPTSTPEPAPEPELPRREVTFWDSGSGFQNALDGRYAAMTGSAWIQDQLNRGDNQPSFKIDPSEFLRRAWVARPTDPEPTASAFSQWVYSLYGSHEDSDPVAMSLGKRAEQAIWERRRAIGGNIDDAYLTHIGSDWLLTHTGLHLRNCPEPHYFEIPNLTVGTMPLRASPDLIYVNREGSQAMIVEIKFSRQRIPRNLWPNIWAQLWCYAQLPQVTATGQVTVLGEIWYDKTITIGRKKHQRETFSGLSLRASVRRNPRAPAFDRFFRRLFEIYAASS